MSKPGDLRNDLLAVISGSDELSILWDDAGLPRERFPLGDSLEIRLHRVLEIAQAMNFELSLLRTVRARYPTSQMPLVDYHIAALEAPELAVLPRAQLSRTAKQESPRALPSRTAGLRPPLISTVPGTPASNPVVMPAQRAFTDEIERQMEGAMEVRLCGWSLIQTLDHCTRALRHLLRQGAVIQCLVMKPGTAATRFLDQLATHLDAKELEARGFPEQRGRRILSRDLQRSLEHLQDLVPPGATGRIEVKLYTGLMPVGLVMIDRPGGEGWASVQLYPLHPDVRYEQRLMFQLTRANADVWSLLRYQFDEAWKDRLISKPFDPFPKK